MKDPSELSGKELDEELSRVYGEIMQFNSEIVAGIRQQIENITAIRDAYLIQADRCGDIILLLASGAAMTAAASGDLLLTEYGLERYNPTGEEDVSDDDSDD